MSESPAQTLRLFGEGLINSYSQVFFSNNKVFAWLLLLVTFLSPISGLSGVIAIVTGQILAKVFYFSEALVKDGTYTYNSLMVGVGMGIMYDPSVPFFIILIFISIITFFLSVWLLHYLSLKGLPFLSIPFLLSIWLVLLGADNFTALQISSRSYWFLGISNEGIINRVAEFVGTLPFPDLLHLYLRSLGAILFQYNDLAGIIIVIGLLVASRMSFVLSVLGFLTGYLFYFIFEGDFSQLVYSYIGFNFILTGIALGGFFLIPSKRSYLLIIVVIPVIALMTSSFSTLFAYFNLPMYSMPFNIVVLLVLYTFSLRLKAGGLQRVALQQFSPEGNYYKFILGKNRFGHETLFHFSLPVLGEWRISQGHKGAITHKEEWKEAWDFDIVNEAGETFRGTGVQLEDYYCYDIPVIAPAPGTIVKVVDGVRDNPIRDVNLEDNWGNSVIIHHAEGLYSKLSHLKKGSIGVSEGDYVAKGDIIGRCGSSGRSPEPHLHFQIQGFPYIGSPTLKYPISYYLVRRNGELKFKEFSIPEEGDLVQNVSPASILTSGFNFIPGQTLRLVIEKNGKAPYEENWKVFTNAYNLSYLYCASKKSTAWFVNREAVFMFTDFYGDTSTALYGFYIIAQKMLLTTRKGTVVKDHLPIYGFFPKPLKLLQDFVAPFYPFLHVDYRSQIDYVDDAHNPGKVIILSNVKAITGKKAIREYEGRITLEDRRITGFEIIDKTRNKTIKCTIKG